MANARQPVAIAQGVGQIGRNFLREVGSLFWFIAHTFEETLERIQQGRVPFRAASFFRHTERAGVDSVPLVGLVSFFLGLTMALLTGYQLLRFGTERLIPGLAAIGLLLGGMACDRGLTVKGGAAGVGTATTSSVLTAITAVIGFDTLYNIVYTTFYPT